MAKYTRNQSYNLKMAKTNAKNAVKVAKAHAKSRGKAASNILKTIGNTVTTNVATHYAQRAIETQNRAKMEQARINAEVEKAKYADSYAKSLATINQAIKGGDNDSEGGSNQSGSTTNVGGSGSKLGG